MKLLFIGLLYITTIFGDPLSISLGKFGSIEYITNNNQISIQRKDAKGKVLYEHQYHYYQEQLIKESLIGDLGEISIKEGLEFISPYSTEKYVISIQVNGFGGNNENI